MIDEIISRWRLNQPYAAPSLSGDGMEISYLLITSNQVVGSLATNPSSLETFQKSPY